MKQLKEVSDMASSIWSELDELRLQELSERFSKKKDREDPFYMEYMTLSLKKNRIKIYNKMED